MSYRNPLEIFHFDKVVLEKKTVKADTRGPQWELALNFPQGTNSWRIHNRGGFTIQYGYQKNPIKWEELEAGVTDDLDNVPRELYVANKETVAGRDVDVFIEYWRPETEDERQEQEASSADQLQPFFDLLHNFLSRIGLGRRL